VEPKVFISYRRTSVAKHIAGRLSDRLSQRFKRASIFIDIDAIRPGRDFVEQLEKALSQCDVVLALIDSTWVNVADSSGARKLDDPNDYVVVELTTALRRGIPVIPVLLEGAAMPQGKELPIPLQPLVRRQSVRLDYDSFTSDSESLMTTLEDILGTTTSRGSYSAQVLSRSLPRFALRIDLIRESHVLEYRFSKSEIRLDDQDLGWDKHSQNIKFTLSDGEDTRDAELLLSIPPWWTVYRRPWRVIRFPSDIKVRVDNITIYSDWPGQQRT
jgi:TIR domain